jgi:hypothetical protein
MSLAASSFGILIFGVLALGILWPLTLGYAIYLMTYNMKTSAIITAGIVLVVAIFCIVTPYASTILLYSAILSLGLALVTWMFDNAV